MQNIHYIDDAARDACLEMGVEYKDVPKDGQFHSADLINDPKGKSDARIKLFPDGQGGIIWNHKTGEQKTFFINHSAKKQPPDPEALKQIEVAKTERQRATLIGQQKAAEKANYVFPKLPTADLRNSYLARKGVQQGYGARQGQNGSLVLPLYDSEKNLVNLQFINPDSTKRFLKGGKKTGCFWWIGKLTETILIAEGFATAASLHEATGHLTFIAYDAGNL